MSERHAKATIVVGDWCETCDEPWPCADERAERFVDTFPPLTPAMRADLALLLRPMPKAS